jgi:hypothetical protein
MKWVKIEERLPTEIKKYLVMVERPDQIRASMELAKRYNHKPAVKISRMDNNFIIQGVVTHWMEGLIEPME